MTRDTIIRICADLGIEFRRSDISREELYTFDELFLTGTAAGVTSVREVDGRMIGKGEWPVTQRLKETYEDTTHGKNTRHADWISLVAHRALLNERHQFARP